MRSTIYDIVRSTIYDIVRSTIYDIVRYGAAEDSLIFGLLVSLVRTCTQGLVFLVFWGVEEVFLAGGFDESMLLFFFMISFNRNL